MCPYCGENVSETTRQCPCGATSVVKIESAKPFFAPEGFGMEIKNDWSPFGRHAVTHGDIVSVAEDDS